MKNYSFSFLQRLSVLAILFVFQITYLNGQSDSKDICKEGDCSPALFTIELTEPREPSPPGQFTASRTENFKQAYLSFEKIKSGYANSSEWQSKYKATQIGGKSCLRHYQLESQLANEYSQNPDFKNFIDAQGSQNNDYLEHGFESSRRGLNLERRMKSNCPDDLEEMKKKKGPVMEDLPKEYMQLGKKLGYFDKDGNVLKPLKDLTPATPATSNKKMSKKEQVEQLKNQVSQLPVGQQMKDKVGGIKNALANAAPKLAALKGLLAPLKSRFAALLPGPIGLLAKIKTANDILGVLKNFVPKLPMPGLLKKIGGLFNRGKKLTDKVKDVDNKSKKLKDRFDDLDKKANDLEKKIKDRTAAINDLQKKLDDLAKKKDELTQKLEDKPKKILDQLKQEVGQAKKEGEDLVDKVTKENDLKDKVLEELDQLNKEKDKIVDELKGLEDKMEELTKEGEDLENETKEVEKEVEAAKEDEKKLDGLNKELDDLKPEAELEAEIADCEDELKELFDKIAGIDQKQKTFKDKVKGFLSKPAQLLTKLTDLKLFQDKLKLPKNGLPLADKALAKLDGLLEKGTALTGVVEIITGKKSKLQETLEGYDQKLDQVKSTYESKTANLDNLRKELVDLIAEKSGVKNKLNAGTEKLNDLEKMVNDYVERYNLFDEKADCKENEDLENEVEELKKEQEETEPEIEELEKEIEKAEEETTELEEETKEVEKEIEEQAELKEEEVKLKEEYGTDVKLEPVTTKEWVEDFEVEREYWDAVFHPDDEVVEGYKGRYFQVKLKDAEKNVKLLFGPGEYYMDKSDFRDNYGSTIGAFVKESLHALKKSDRDKILVFIQGSADIAGHKTFRGNLDKKYFYDEVTVLPHDEDEDHFSNTSADKEIPEKGFKNTDLPNLRGQYLKEMIRIYSKKIDPILLEGKVKKENDEEERNAVIYLFIPDELVEEYGGE